MSSPFLDAAPRQLAAPDLRAELRETIANWFEVRARRMQDSKTIIAALADLAAEQFAAIPATHDQEVAMQGFADRFINAVNAANSARRVRDGGQPITKQ